MIDVLSVDNMRQSDKACMLREGIDECTLVARVAAAIYAAVDWQAPVAVLCGKGNNGADGLALAAILHENGVPVSVFYLQGKGPTHEFFLQNLSTDIPCTPFGSDCRLDGFATVVDCLVGTGFKGSPQGALVEAIDAVNHSGAYVISVDINSGLDADSGMATACVRSHLTLSVGGYKPGHLLNMAADVIGSLRNLDVGITPVLPPYHRVERTDMCGLIPPRRHFANKGDYGYVALVGGSLPYSGAIRLASMAAAAMRCGAGVVKVALPGGLCPLVVPHVLESTLFPLDEQDGFIRYNPVQLRALTQRVRVVAFGMGVGVTEGAADTLGWLLADYQGRLVVDADGLTMLAAMPRDRLSERRCRLVLTPHAKECARLAGCDVKDVLARPIEVATGIARDYGALVLLKGPTTVVTDGKEVHLLQVGAAGMATAGSGDVLSGILAATLAYVPDITQATLLGAYINGMAGAAAQREVGSVSMIASDTVAHIPQVVRDITGE